jgi:2-polyprenyl-3-methyl-5-hydroxy-6-metoxy-1,4-benzoquinol methylase
MTRQPAFERSSDAVSNLKSAMRDAWNTPGVGYQEMAEGFTPAVEHLLDFAGIKPGMSILDVATGSGVAAIAAARRGATVTAIDFAPDLLEHARQIAADAGVSVNFLHGDAEDLDFPDSSFDAVISTFGCMFAPRPDAVAYEMCRVLKPGGLLALATWKPEGPNYCLMNITAPYLPPRVQEIPSPLNWGRREHVAGLLSAYVADIRFDDGDAAWIVESPVEALDMLFRRCLGPTVYTYRKFDHQNKMAVRADAMALMRENQQPDGSVHLSRHYLLIAARKPGA